MSTILTDDEIQAEGRNGFGIDPILDGPLMEFARAVEAAVLAKLAQQEPVAWMCSDTGLSLKGYSRFSPNCEGAWNIPVYTHPAPRQADRQRVPDGYVLVPVEPTDEMVDAACDKSDFFRVDFVRAWDAAVNASPELTQSATSHTHKVVPVTPTKEMLISGARAPVELLSPDGALQVYRAMLAAAPEAPAHRLQSDPIFQQAVEFTANRAPEAPAQAEVHRGFAEAPAQHLDDAAVDDFARAMKVKLAKAREKGRSGWETCPPEELSRMLREHIDKGDPLDVANFCMFLWFLGHGIGTAAPEAPAQAESDLLTIAYMDGFAKGKQEAQKQSDRRTFDARRHRGSIQGQPLPRS